MKSALRCEIGVDILKGHLAWINGGFPARYWPDIEIFKHGLGSWLNMNERVGADNGYIGEARMKVKWLASVPNQLDCTAMQSIVSIHQETINKRLALVCPSGSVPP